MWAQEREGERERENKGGEKDEGRKIMKKIKQVLKRD